jgi:hypothetical protein
VVEIFPKPRNPDPKKLPKQLNMPFFGKDYGIIYPGSKVNGAMTVEFFLRYKVEYLTADQCEALVKARGPRKASAGAAADDNTAGAEFAAVLCAEYTVELAAATIGGNPLLYKRGAHMGNMICSGWIEREAVEQAFLTAIAHWDDQPRHRDTLKSALDAGMRTPHPDLDTGVIRVRDGQLLSMATRGEEALVRSDLQIYQHRGRLARPVIEEAEATLERKTKVAQFVEVDEGWLRPRLGVVIPWQKYNERRKQWMATEAPPDVVKTILRNRGEWTFPAVSGIIMVPTMRPDGSLLTVPGYDEVTRLLLIEPPSMPPIPDKPTQDDALAALKLLKGLLVEFPLVDDMAHAGALSMLITPVVRGAFMMAPMHAVTAPAAGTGKSYLLDVVAAIAIGNIMPVKAAGKTPEETEKRLVAAVRTGRPLISIDNVSDELGGDLLCQLIERPESGVRVLGTSDEETIRNRAFTTFCNGNNLVIRADACRRVILTSLNAEVEQPEHRKFTGNPVETVLANRGAYIAAALTVCRAYFVAKRRGRADRLGSYEGWSDTVRSALMWLGEADPVASMDAVRAEDPDRKELADMLAAWAATFGTGSTHRCRLQDVVDMCKLVTNDGPIHKELHAAVQATARGRREVDAKSLGRWAQQRKSRIVNGRRLACEVNPKGGSLWWVQAQDGKDVPPEKPGESKVDMGHASPQHDPPLLI